MLCLDLSTECLTTCDEIRYDDPELDDCYMLVEWYPNDNYNSEEIIEECYFAYIGSGRCCITPPEPGFYYPKVLVQYLINGESSGAEYNLEVDYQDCSTVVVNSTTTWNSSNVSEFARFDLITVQSGVTLTIAADLTLNFCEEGQLVINPGGRVILNGILTADCENGWFGVQVQGNSSTNQFPQSGVYSQGRLFCNPGSRIELAYTAVRLFGPDYEDTGGMIYADGCTFINNRCGIYFAPFNNYFVNPGKPRNYFSSIRNCVFDIVEERPMPAPFIYHIAMYKVNGIFISGTSFGNHRHIEDASDPRPYGIGIRAIDSGFNVGSTAENIEDEPCLDPCINPSKFFGLGNGISTNRVGRNRPFQVFDAEFSNCYFGIVNDGVSGCLIVSNNFEMGAVKNLIGDEDQVGISLSGYLAGLTVEENQFFHSDDEITENSLGIVVNQIGEMDNVIRKNKFIQITVGNEAFGLNADIDPTAHQGLHYLCNENTAVQLNDFYFPDDVTVEDYIRDWQGLIDEDEVLAAGNTFSETGDPDDGDFANHGEWTVSYFYDDNEQSQTPEDYTGIGALVPSDPNNCAVIFCLNPCLTLEGFEEEIDAFYTNTEDFDEAIDEEDFELAAYYRMKLDSNIFNILGYIQYDTSAFERDTLRAWFHRAGSIAGDLLLAADYYDTGEFMRMNRTIDSIPAWHDLTPGQAFDLNRLKYVFGILSVRSVFSLTSTDIDSLTLYSKEIGAAASLARGTLAILDTLFTPRYYIPGEVNPRSDNYTTSPLSGLTKIKVYPNPLKDILTVEVPVNFGPGLTMEFIDINGKVMSELKLNPGHNEVEIRNIIDNHLGIVIYRISSEDGIIDFGKLINLR